jgi:hypothetical protein
MQNQFQMQQQQQQQQYGNRYGLPEQQPQAKQFDSFAHLQQSAPPQPSTTQTQTQHHQSQQQNYGQYMQPQQPSHLGLGVSSAEQHYGYGYATADRSQPPGFGLYANSYGMQQQTHTQQEAGASQQRASSGLGGSVEASGQVPTSAAVPGQQPNSRYGAPAGDQNSGHGTPSPAPVQASQQHQAGMGQYPMQQQFHPYYQQYMHQVRFIHQIVRQLMLINTELLLPAQPLRKEHVRIPLHAFSAVP